MKTKWTEPNGIGWNYNQAGGQIGPQLSEVYEFLGMVVVPVVGTDLVGEMTRGPWSGRIYVGASVVADGSGAVLAILQDRDTEVHLVNLEVAPQSKR
jgi:hypothetical protein